MDFVSILIGSKSDYEVIKETLKILENFEVKYELIISSAHRSPKRTKEYIIDAEKRGAKVFIAAAGMAAHLAGTCAAYTIKPVLGVPMPGSNLASIDSLFSTVQMPSGIPVGTLAIGKAGAINAAYLAIQILAIDNTILTQKLKQDRFDKEQKLIFDSKVVEVLL
ncbi:5-(carboxyamino)imidazole ribonucleotide mutase [Campylobacter hepaticus]|uniref:N5-carboxyaminoimidazole ribonucleotide mutase n=1 Tax=Campylobacter hepaticus TaxID=1813019 RepID=A0A6A7JRW8_9BACT|nr:5-(carboxyamino)imidazole ribonucleotide mutase [Campylobacter hepaticus]AXP08715.1 5-(carboxyamino)imidazole ribonucleotide mutase [Campylobacter hepaticus]MCZ0772563.1 5-(carboxyamino)imidazole ribonucleotide mutase [Campylobacter hepaticus]MCZ0774031.1 5-(carboxyamino)imidazole ribonucleotide mutase [Campylobacter hepaticus]MCZ0775283.1 5-(carboxyamino)imidazole ribonucleotide mutase [Campylobacter hepaticus]MDX2322995.1 5-(carboxyamino)imidazole ribonucleotide mutase [Campylobacter hepa